MAAQAANPNNPTRLALTARISGARTLASAVLVVSVVLLVGCTADDERIVDRPTVSPELVEQFDADGDGQIVIGIATAGPADDGAYSQAVVDAVESISAEHGFSSPIVVDGIQAADAPTALADLAVQVDIMVIGSGGIAGPSIDLAQQFPDVFWYCNCGAGFPQTPGLAQSLDDPSEVAYSAGVATALLLGEEDRTEAILIGCCDLGFEKEFELAFQLGLQETNQLMTLTYVPSGEFLYDFDNVGNAIQVLDNALARDVGAVLPYLAGAHRPVVAAANQAGIVTMSAGSSTVCDTSEELDYDIAIRFDGGDYMNAVFPLILSGELVEGQSKLFRVGVDPEPGAIICEPTADQKLAMDQAYAQIASGELGDAFAEIKAEAYSG